MRYILSLMFILPIFQTWLIWNDVMFAEILDDGLYGIFILLLLYKIIKEKKYKNFKNILVDENIKKSVLFVTAYLGVCLILTLTQMIFRDYISIKGVVWELYKLTRNIFILVYAWLYVDEKDFYKYVKLYIYICLIEVFVLVNQLIFGYKFYELMNFLPNAQEYPDFYNFYIPQKRNVGTFAHANVLGEFLAFAFAIMFYALSTGKKIFNRKNEDMVYMIIILAGVLLSTSRMTLLLTIGITIFMVFRFNIQNGKEVIKKSLLITIPFGLFGLSKLAYKMWEYYYYNIVLGSTEMRIQAWKQAIMMFGDYWYTGTGLGTWGDASAGYSSFNYSKQLDGVVNTLSDSYLSHLIVESGIYILFLVLCIYLLYKFFISALKKSRFFALVNIHCILFVCIASFKSMGLSVFEASFFVYFLVGYSIKEVLETK